MKLSSASFRHNEPIPGHCAFGIPDGAGRMKLGQNRNPQLSWSGIPATARSLVLLCIDIDVPSSLDNFNKDGKVIAADLPRVEFCHWAVVDIPPRDGSIAEGESSDGITPRGKKNPPGPPDSRQGINEYTDFMAADPDMAGDYYGYEGPCSPWNDERRHRYVFTLYATDLDRCPVEGRFGGADVLKAIRGHVLAEASITGTYTLNTRML
ncbi:MAG: YbhB/YbcL family Raf kinase inhibitor-like protein [Gammaproteobacteria bacterium]|nr:YbhB/YbcL family Raf kinase inhibitor-like protein [Gammaproteobacteria bacterium]